MAFTQQELDNLRAHARGVAKVLFPAADTISVTDGSGDDPETRRWWRFILVDNAPVDLNALTEEQVRTALQTVLAEIQAQQDKRDRILADLERITRDDVQTVLDNITADITAIQNATSLADVRQPILRTLNRQAEMVHVIAALVAESRAGT